MPPEIKRADAAAELVSRYGFQVFPLAPGKKHPPLLKDFPNRATSKPETARAWWTKRPDANVAVHCAGLLVVDLDEKKDGPANWNKLQAAPHTFTVATPGGGYHLYFACPGDVRNSVGKLGPGIDIRSRGGYVVAPGSETAAGVYKIVSDTPPVPAPEWLVQAAGAFTEPERTESPEHVDPEMAAARAADYLSRAPAAVEGEGGDAHTFAVICRIRDIGVAEDDAFEVLEQWNEKCEPPWDHDALEQKIHNAYRYAQNSPGVLSVEAMFDIIEEQPAAPPVVSEEELYCPDEVVISDVLRSQYLIKGWLDLGSQALMFGKWGAGKTFITIHMAAHLAAGVSWFGRRVTQGGVLYLGYEGELAMKKRVYALRQEFPELPLESFLIRPMRWPLVAKGRDAKTAGQERVERALRAFKDRTGAYPSLIVIDPLRNALGGSDSDPDLTAPYLAYLQKLTKATGCATLTVHHPGHGDAERGRGDSGIEAHMDTVIKVDGDAGRIETRKQRDDPSGSVNYRLRVVSLGNDQDGDPRTTCVVEQVTDNPLDPALTDGQQLVLDTLRELVGDGEVTKGAWRTAGKVLPPGERKRTWDTLLQKRYLVEDNGAHRLGAGAAELFNETDEGMFS